MSKQLTLNGWIGKSFNGNVLKANKHFRSNDSAEHVLPGVFATKGRKSDWSSTDWPPTKVIITVELHKNKKAASVPYSMDFIS